MNKYTIIIPIHNAYDLAKRCIESVLKNTSKEHQLILVDDGSKDPRVASLFGLLTEWPADHLLLILNGSAQGFVKTINHCLRVSDGDIIILNSDTEVPPNWIERMDAARMDNELATVELGTATHPAIGRCVERQRVASVCPLSNFATVYSVPNAGMNDMPAYLTVEQMDRIVEETSFKLRPIVPTTMGFCMLMTRSAICAIGGFDELFGLGYGEEVDWTLRARAAGFVCALADDLFVYHKGKASFGTGDDAIREGMQGENLVRERYPEYIKEIQDWYFTSQLREHKTRIADRLRPRTAKKKLKVLYVLHRPLDALGGTEIYVRRLVAALTPDVESTVIYPVSGGFPSDGFITCDPSGTMLIQINQELCKPKLFVRGYPLQLDAPLMCDFFEKTIRALKPDLVHVHHLAAWGTWDILQVAEKYAPVVMTIEDQHFNCPVFKMGGSCQKAHASSKDDECIQCIKSQVTSVGHYMDESIEDHIRGTLAKWFNVTYPPNLIAPSAHVARQVYGENNNATIIPHGCPEPLAPQVRVKSDKIRLAYVGLASIEKGWNAFREVALKLQDDPRFEVSVIGYVDPQCEIRGLERVRFAGAYHESNLAAYLQNVDIAIPACMLVESYGIVIDECLAAGCHVVVPDLPVLLERLPKAITYRWGNGESLLEALQVTKKRIWYIPQTQEYLAHTTAESAARTLVVYLDVVG